MRNPVSRTAREARRKRAQMDRVRLINDFRPPEGVPLSFEVAGLGMRFAAQTIDLLITFGFIIALWIVLALLGASWSLLAALGSILYLLIRAPYYIATELVWNGQTLGKRICRLRVISADGRSLRPYSVAVRNVMKEMEVFVPLSFMFMDPTADPLEYFLVMAWVAILLAVPMFNRRRQRLGDMMAGTYVIHQPQTVLVPDLATRADAEVREKFAFLAHHLDHYGAYELQTLERVLHVDTHGQGADLVLRHNENLKAIADKIRGKIGYTDPVADGDVPQFLEAFYAAQRRYLESRKLFGDARVDKFHKEDKPEPAR